MSNDVKRGWSAVSWVTLAGVALLLSFQAWNWVARMFAPVPFHYDALIVPEKISPGSPMVVSGTITKSRDCAGTSSMRIIDSNNVFYELFSRSIGARPPSTYNFQMPLTVPAGVALGPAVFSIVAVSNCGGDDYVERVLRDVTVEAAAPP